MQQTIFSVRKVEKNLDKLRFYWANMRKKAARPAIPKRGSNHSPFFPAFLLTTLYTTFTMLDTFGAFIQTKAQKYVTIMLRLDLPLFTAILLLNYARHRDSCVLSSRNMPGYLKP